jgi:hypothetical protein
MLERLVQAGDFREAVLVADCLLLLARQLPPGGAAVVSEAAAGLCEQQEPEVCHAPTARALLELLVRCSGAGQDAQLLQQVAQDLQRAVGSADDTQLTGSETMPLLAGDRNIQAAASFVAAYCDEGLAEMDKVGCGCGWVGGCGGGAVYGGDGCMSGQCSPACCASVSQPPLPPSTTHQPDTLVVYRLGSTPLRCISLQNNWPTAPPATAPHRCGPTSRHCHSPQRPQPPASQRPRQRGSARALRQLPAPGWPCWWAR